jgi:phospholipid-binding lipoprotein MlaA
MEPRVYLVYREALRTIAVGLLALWISVPVNVSGAAAEPDDPPLGLPVATSEGTLPEAAAGVEGSQTPEAEPPGGPVDATQGRSIAAKDEYDEEYDPWEPFNEKTFWLNRNYDQYLLKPVATAYDKVVPNVVQKSLKNALANVGVVRRLVNNVLQLNFPGAGREVSRFLINSTLGVAGFFDVAKSWFDLEKSDRDTGQTLGVWGVGHGPYLVLPLLPPLTVRDGIGFVVDVALDPVIYFAPFAATAGRTGTTLLNDRSLYLGFFENVEETTLDLYSAVRNGYLQRRAKAVMDAKPNARGSSPSQELSIELRPATD